MDKETLSLDDINTLAISVLKAAGCDDANASAIAEVIVSAERDHCHAHGLLRLPAYARSLKSGKSNGRAAPSSEWIAPGVLRVDGDNGFTPVSHKLGCTPLADLAKEQGIAALAIVNTHHFAALWPEIELMAAEGVTSIAVTSAFPIVAPPGGSEPLFGTNPIAFGWPRPGHDPVVFDQATAAMAHGEVLVAEREGRELPEGVVVDADGKPSTNPSDVHGGSIQAFGGVKGALISMMVELLAGALIGEQFSFEVGRANAPDGSANRGGELIIAMDPARLGDGDGWSAHADAFFAEMMAQDGVRLPGARRYQARKQSEKEGVAVPVDLLETVRELGGG